MKNVGENPSLQMAGRALDRAVDHIGLVQLALLDGDIEQAMTLAAQVNDDAQRARRLFQSAGVMGSFQPHAQVAAATIPLHALDTPDSRRLLELLREAMAVAERVDASRGRTLPADLPLQPGESRGTDLAESISELCLRLRLEIEGPRGRE